MPNYRSSSILFLLVFLLFMICRLPWPVYPALLLVYMGITAGMAFFPASGYYYREVLTHGDRSKNFLSLTFDDGPDAQNTSFVLDILKKHNIKAVFFIIGKKIRGNEELLKRMVDEGHVIGNHTWSHTNLWDLYSSGRMADDIWRNILETERITGKRMKLFRPPYGVINPMVAKAIRKTAVKVVIWSFRSFDTSCGDPGLLLAKTLENARPGDVMLFHDNVGSTAGILEKIIVSLQKRGFSFIPLDEMLKLQTYENC
jgi:peptidoglycan/xylan/chitin deacetylase (PgdA/CDA1 family)